MKGVMDRDKQANILMFVPEMLFYQTRHWERFAADNKFQYLTIQDGDAREANDRARGACVIVAELDFESRIPIQGITDVVSPAFRPIMRYDEDVRKELKTPEALSKWQLDFIKSHLDPDSLTPKIHYVCPRQAKDTLSGNFDPAFLNGDCVDYWIGLMGRMSAEKTCGDDSPIRYIVPLAKLHRVVDELQNGLLLLGIKPTKFNTDRRELVLNLMDRTGLDCRAAVFLHDLREHVDGDSSEEQKKRRDFLLVGILVVVFDRAPVLRRLSFKLTAHLRDLKLGHDSILQYHSSDSWINAVFWMLWAKKAEQEGMNSFDAIQEHNWRVIEENFTQAEAKVKSLASKILGNCSFVERAKDGSLLGQIKSWLAEGDEMKPAFEYLHAYMYNLLYLKRDDFEAQNYCYGTDISSGRRILVDPRKGVVNLESELKYAASQGNNGIHACVSSYRSSDEKREVEGVGLTIVSPVVVQSLLKDIRGPSNLHIRLSLK
ncbi:uncharacterized protein F4812DRAFT_468015 [Daldinia caldariorum]|uniref:uncharacterized protein n=1 Tax=Daldinia caldariorum TaxID=326644 RepID=UPI0020080768|nr:uncharacterized protein F4812DRAFT_468015 [Daldinia caldariorum]KAI1464377.1 hypothetical protein F4812DRAFT_468015 [Daldinia caldariorum]